MIKILVVDDEITIRKGIISILIRELGSAYEFFEAENGIQALLFYEKHTPEIIITDINMPKINGLKFISILKQKNLKVFPSVIILTGYDDFHYAKEAIHIGVIEYLLKPVNREELIHTVKNAFNNIKIENQKKINKIQNDILKFENSELKTNKNLNLLITDVSFLEKRKAIDELFKENLITSYSFFQCMVFQQRRYFKNEKNNYNNLSIKRFLNQLIQPGHNAIFFEDNSSNVVAIIFGNNLIEISILVEHLINNFQHNVMKYFNTDSFIGIGKSVDNILNVNNSYNEALFACMYKIISKRGYYTWNDNDVKLNKKQNFKFIFDFETALELGDYKHALSIIDSFFQDIQENFIYFVFNINNLYFIMNKILHANDTIVNIRFAYLCSFWDLDELKDYIKTIVFRFCDNLINSRIITEKEIVLKIIKYISMHFNENINLNIVSYALNRNSSYLSNTFKKETGENFTDFLLRYRINYSKKLLNHVEYSIKEIGTLSGFSNAKHFITTFKKITGKTPNSFRSEKLSLISQSGK